MERKIWEPREIDPDRIYRMDAGERSVFTGYTAGEWRIATFLERGRTRLSGWEEIGDLSGPGGETAGYEWTRIVIPNSNQVIRAVPVMPDKPLVIRPLYPIFLPEGGEGQFFVEIPLGIRINGSREGAGSGEILLAEVSTKVMSRTWFGNFSAGELCYAGRTGVSREPPFDGSEHPAPVSLRAVCSVRINNSSSTLLEIGSFCLRTEFLAVFEGKNRLWSSPVELVYRGQEDSSQTTGTGPPRQLSGEGRLLTPAKAVPDNSIVRRSFSFLKDLTGW